MFKHQKNQQQQNQQQRTQPSRAWQDDDDDNAVPSSNYRPKQNQPQSQSQAQVKSSYQAQPRYNNQPPQQSYEASRKGGETFPLEQKLVNDILQPTGISIKPSEHILNDFLKRARNLDREKIFNTMLDTLNNFESYVTSQDQVKMLTKCLYLVEYMVMNRLEDIYEAFEERVELFESIKGAYPTNKKVNDICRNIIRMYLPKDYNKKKEEESMGMTGKGNVNLLDIDEGDGNSNTEGNANVNLLDGIFGGSMNMPMPMQQDQPLNVMQIQTQPIAESFDNIFSTAGLNNALEENNKGGKAKKFSFIKEKGGDDGKSIEQIPQKKGFDFIKTKTPSSQPIQSDLTDIFSSTVPSSSSTSTSTISNPIDLTKIQFIKPEEPKFNYEHVYENTNLLKDKTEKDPFNFVNAMIKSKKP